MWFKMSTARSSSSLPDPLPPIAGSFRGWPCGASAPVGTTLSPLPTPERWKCVPAARASHRVLDEARINSGKHGAAVRGGWHGGASPLPPLADLEHGVETICGSNESLDGETSGRAFGGRVVDGSAL